MTLVLSVSCLVFGLLPLDVPPSEPASEADAGSDAPLVQPGEAGVTPPRLSSDTLAAGDVARFPEPVLPWPRTVPRVGAWDIAATGALGVATVVLQLTYTQPATPNWSGGILFDDWFRRVLRLSSDSARATAASASDFLLYGLVTLPFLDAWLGAGVTYGRPDIALKLSLLDAEAMLSTTFITLGAQHLTLRARPFVSLCAHEPTARECTDGSAQDTSFPSGHTSIGFTVAMLECVNHAHLDVEHTGWNAVACPVSLATAGLTGILRIMADRHFASDVIVGGLIGAGIGYLVPTLHYAVASKNTTTAIIPVMAPGYAGLALAGGF